MKVKSFILVMVSCIFIIQCTMQPTSVNDNINNDTDSLTSNERVVETDDAYIIDGDMVFGKENPDCEKVVNAVLASSKVVVYANDGRGNFLNSGNNILKWKSSDQHYLTYSFAPNMATHVFSDQEMRAAYRRAFAAWSARVQITFREVSAGAKIQLDVSDIPPYAGLATYWWDSNYNIVKATISIDDDAIDYYVNIMQDVMMHEIGHVIGMAHEHQRADSPYQYDQGTDGIPFGAYDPNSIMNYARPYNMQLTDGDIAAARYLYGTRSVYDGWMDSNDLSFVEGDKLTLLNTSYSGGAIHVIDLITGNDVLKKNYSQMTPSLSGWVDSDDLAFVDDNKLILINTTIHAGALRVIDLNNGNSLLFKHHSEMSFNGWLDSNDLAFVEDNKLILVNSGLYGGAIRVIDLNTGNNLLFTLHSEMSLSLNGWLDSNDHAFVEDNKLTLINTTLQAGAIRVIDLNNGNDLLFKHHSEMSLNGWLDSNDRSFVKNNKLTLINTSYTAGAIRVIDLDTGNNLLWKNHSEISLNGWLDSNDRSFVRGNKLTLINSSYTGGAIRVIDLDTGNILSTRSHAEVSPSLNGWLDSSDRSYMVGTWLGLINTTYHAGAIRVMNVNTGENTLWLNH